MLPSFCIFFSILNLQSHSFPSRFFFVHNDDFITTYMFFSGISNVRVRSLSTLHSMNTILTISDFTMIKNDRENEKKKKKKREIFVEHDA